MHIEFRVSEEGNQLGSAVERVHAKLRISNKEASPQFLLVDPGGTLWYDLFIPDLGGGSR